MTPHPRGLHHAPRTRALGLALALAIGSAACVDAQAARAGHARVASLPGEPMRIEIPLVDLTADEASSLQVRLADADSWQRAGLQPPAPLADTRVSLEGGGAARRVVRITATQPITTQTVDVLLDLRSSAGQRQMQVTLLVPARDAEAGLRRAAVAPSAPASASGATPAVQRVGDVTVRPGQTLSGIAARHAVADASIYQMLVALWQANPQAFIQNNMNLVRAGETLAIPDAATVRAIDPAEARRIFVEQAAAYDRYRGRLGAAAAAGATVPRADGTSGQVDDAGSGRAAVQPPARDRLRLSNAAGGAGGSAEAAGDARASDQRAMNDARQRVDTLQSNVDALNRAAAGQGGANAVPGQAGGAGASGAAPGSAASQGAAGAGGRGNASQSSAGNDAGTAAGAGGVGAASGGAAAGTAAGAAGAAAGSRVGANGPAAGAGEAGGNAATGGAPATARNNGGLSNEAQGNRGQGSGAQGNAAQANGTQNPAAQDNDAAGAASTAAPGQAGMPAQAGAGGGTAGTPSTQAGAAGGAQPAQSGAAGSAPSAQPGTDSAGQAKVGMPSWLAANLLVIVTAVLALLVFIVAWMLRRAGTRRNEDVEEVDYGDPPPFDSRAFNRKLDAIDLDLNHPPTDEPKPDQGDASSSASPSATPSNGKRT